MKQTLEYLPELKRNELKRIISVIRDKCDDVEMIILFGSYARGDYKIKADLKPNRKSGHVSDYDILAVTGKKKTVDNISLWDTITKTCKVLKLSAYPRVITHDIQELNIKLAEGQYFFSDIKKDGCMLFDSGRFRLVNERNLTCEEKQRIAQDYFDHWFATAKNSFKLFSHSMNDNIYNWAAFHLHQTAEHSYKTVLLVFTNYAPNEHWLAALNDMVVEENNSFDNIFPNDTEEEKDRLTLLDYAYIGARYDPDYRISKNDLEILALYVKKLLDFTKKICKHKIESFRD